MKTFTISAIAFYTFYVLNGLLAPGQAARQQQLNCQGPSIQEAVGKSGDVGACKRDALIASRSVSSN